MIYFKFCDIPSKKSLRGKNVFIKLWDRISSSLGKFLNANPDFESKIDEVEQWVVEYDNTEYHQAIREIGIDSQGNIILKMPDDRNYGFWLDTGFTLNDFKKFGINYITEDEFNNLWNSVCYDRNNKIFKSLEDGSDLISNSGDTGATYTNSVMGTWDGSSVHGLQGLNALILGGNFVERYNYYEDFIDLHKTKWWGSMWNINISMGSKMTFKVIVLFLALLVFSSYKVIRIKRLCLFLILVDSFLRWLTLFFLR